ILIIDFGSQLTQLIARRVREHNVYCEIHPFNHVPEIDETVKGIILSGSPCSVREEDAPMVDLEHLISVGPVLGVCYGAQLLAHTLGGNVEASTTREYGRAILGKIEDNNSLFANIAIGSQTWMSHGDTITSLPSNARVIASTDSVEMAAFQFSDKEVYGIQFHPEVTHTTDGKSLIKNFLVGICGCNQTWTSDSFVETSVAELKEQLDVFDDESHQIQDVKWLAQGTIYPDIIESVSVKGPSATIKSHHNVGGLPDYMKLKIVEPLKLLFKDGVREVGAAMDMPKAILSRHPFPGPGLGIRILGDITAEKVRILQEVDYFFIQGLKDSGLYDGVWQAGSMLLPVQSVGVMGDERTYESVVALRAVTSVDGMTADWAHLPYEFLADVSNKIINNVKGVNRVVYDISSKPPATIEWE
ncbi:UNVERIFIED_CONTAM: hypothetical protein GTU68_038004, partial [Idotea baltica]|nr:hypothetical protein [Idotea baltica]